MRFGDICKNVLSKAFEKLQQMNEECEAYYNMYNDLDNETLIRYFKDTGMGFTKRRAISLILRDRGYNMSNENAEEDEYP